MGGQSEKELRLFIDAVSALIEKGRKMELDLPIYLLKMVKLHLIAETDNIGESEVQKLYEFNDTAEKRH